MKRVVAGWSGVFVLGTVAVLAVPAVRAGDQAKAATAVDLSGRWRLNSELSDNEEAKTRAAVATTAEKPPASAGGAGKAEGQAPEDRRGGGDRGGAARGATGRATPAQSVDENDPLGAKRTSGAAGTMTVTQTSSEIMVVETPGQTRELFPNGRTYKMDEGATQIRTSWENGRLVVEKKNVRGWRLVETWELARDRSRVTIHLLYEGGSRPKLALTRVYDRNDESAPQ